MHYFFILGCPASSLLRGLSLLAANGGYSPAVVCALLVVVASLLEQSTGSRAQAQELWCTGLAALQYVGLSWIRDQTCVSRIGRRILYH